MTAMEATQRDHTILIFRVGSITCCVPVDDVESIITPPERLTRIPQQASFVVGLFQHRERTASAVCVRHKFGLSPRTDHRTGKLIMVSDARGLVGYWVDEIVEIASAGGFEWSEPPRLIPGRVFDSTMIYGDEIVLHTDFERLFNMSDVSGLDQWAAAQGVGAAEANDGEAVAADPREAAQLDTAAQAENAAGEGDGDSSEDGSGIAADPREAAQLDTAAQAENATGEGGGDASEDGSGIAADPREAAQLDDTSVAEEAAGERGDAGAEDGAGADHPSRGSGAAVAEADDEDIATAASAEQGGDGADTDEVPSAAAAEEDSLAQGMASAAPAVPEAGNGAAAQRGHMAPAADDHQATGHRLAPPPLGNGPRGEPNEAPLTQERSTATAPVPRRSHRRDVFADDEAAHGHDERRQRVAGQVDTDEAAPEAGNVAAMGDAAQARDETEGPERRSPPAAVEAQQAGHDLPAATAEGDAVAPAVTEPSAPFAATAATTRRVITDPALDQTVEAGEQEPEERDGLDQRPPSGRRRALLATAALALLAVGVGKLYVDVAGEGTEQRALARAQRVETPSQPPAAETVLEAMASPRADTQASGGAENEAASGVAMTAEAAPDMPAAMEEDSAQPPSQPVPATASDGAAADDPPAPPAMSPASERERPLFSPVPTGFGIHVVDQGDTLWYLSRRYLGNPWRYPELARSNRITDPDLIFPGDRVRYPQTGQDGDH